MKSDGTFDHFSEVEVANSEVKMVAKKKSASLEQELVTFLKLFAKDATLEATQETKERVSKAIAAGTFPETYRKVILDTLDLHSDHLFRPRKTEGNSPNPNVDLKTYFRDAYDKT